MTSYERSALDCPRCGSHARRSPLFHRPTGGLGMNGCGACGGVFLATECSRKLLAACPEEVARVSAHASQHAPFRADTGPLLTCPVCRRAMSRVHAAMAGVDLDVCAEHGTFYDRAEIELIIAAMRKSGWHAGPAVAAAALVGGGAVAAATGSGSAGGVTTGTVVEEIAAGAGQVALEIGAEAVLDGIFAVIGSLFD